MRRNWNHLILISVTAIFLSGCAGEQSSLNPAGDHAGDISRLWWIFCGVLTAVYALVLVFTALAISRGNKILSPPNLAPDPQRERNLAMAIGGLTAVTAVILMFFMVKDFWTGHGMQQVSDPQPLCILITGHQWWWEVQYENESPDNIILTANEIHLPAGKVVQFDLQSGDVIHSFWAPNFDGKKDLVPGHPTSFAFRPTKTGKFFGQCAEFCGLQHAHMRFEIVVQSPEQFEQWRQAQLQPAAAPADDLQKRGQEVFMTSSCVVCHTISGTLAHGSVGPELSHVGSRQKIAAGTLERTPDNLAHWIANPPAFKPGTRMPQHNLTPGDLQALVAYLEHLK